MPRFVSNQRQYRTLRFGRTMDLIVMDQRRYRANQPCDDAVAPPCADWDQPRDFLGQTQMKYVQNQLKSSKAAWKVLGNEVTIMPTKVLGGSFFTFDSWQGYPREREQLTTFIRDSKVADVIFLTGDIHTFITGDVRTNMGEGDNVAIELVAGSVTSQGLGESDIQAGGGITLKGNDQNPHTDPAIIETLRGINPWVKAADFDHHGFGEVTATQSSFDCKLVRLETIKQRSKATLAPGSDYALHIVRGQKSLFS
jgi:alkaline phosphatase D